jgi:phosphoribosylanthranilate isomerase
VPTRIKNCGLKTTQAIDASIRTGAHFVGFVHHAASPRHVDLDALSALIAHAAGRIKTVAVLQAPTQAQVWEIANIAKPDYLQLHHVPADHIQAIIDETGIPIISAISVRSESDLALAATLEEISDHLLFDAPQSGSGKSFDWRLLKNLPLKKRWFLAGGLNADNVAEAMRSTHAPMVDVSSGIEDRPGEKSLEKIAAFNAAVLHAKA